MIAPSLIQPHCLLTARLAVSDNSTKRAVPIYPRSAHQPIRYASAIVLIAWVDELEDSAPEGVSVVPMMTRSVDPEKITTLILYFAANVDVVAVAGWLFDKLSGAKHTQITHKHVDIKLDRNGFRLIIEQESHTKKG